MDEAEEGAVMVKTHDDGEHCEDEETQEVGETQEDGETGESGETWEDRRSAGLMMQGLGLGTVQL